jgi:hypothetical protein
VLFAVGNSKKLTFVVRRMLVSNEDRDENADEAKQYGHGNSDQADDDGDVLLIHPEIQFDAAAPNR